jgi:hypothetical protein
MPRGLCFRVVKFEFDAAEACLKKLQELKAIQSKGDGI